MPPRTYTSSEEGYDRRTYEVTLTDTRESTGSASLEPAQGFVRMMGGEADDLRLSPLWPRELRMSLFQQQDLSVLTTSAEGDVEIDISTTAQGTRAKGMLFPDEFEDSPFGLQPDVVELAGSDGIPLLGNLSFTDVSYSVATWPQVTASRLLWILLSEVHGTSIPVEVGMNYYPETSFLTNSDCPLANVTLDPSLYEDETALTALKDLLTPFGLQIRQTYRNGSVRWHIRQPEVALGGSYQVWEITASGTSVLDSSLDVSRTLTANELEDYILEDHGRKPSRPRKRVVGTHNHADVQYLVNSGFEEAGDDPNTLRRWTVGSPWTPTGGTGLPEGTGLHSNHPETPSATANNALFAKIDADSAESGVQWAFEQVVPVVLPEDALQIQWQGRQSPDLNTAMRVQGGAYVLREESTNTRSGSRPGEVVLPVDPLTADIPEGTQLPTYSSAVPVASGFETTIKLSQRATAGDTQLVGELSGEIHSGWWVWYLQFTNTFTDPYFDADIFTPPPREDWQTISVRAAMKAEDGTVVDGKELDFRIGALKPTDPGTTEVWWLDDVEVIPIIDGGPADSMQSVASVDTHGTEDEFESLLGSGPNYTNTNRLQGFPIFDETRPVVDLAPPDDIRVSGDWRAVFPAGTEVYLNGAGESSGFYMSDAVAYDSNNDQTTISVDASVHELVPGASVTGSTEVSKVAAPAFDAFYWGIGPNPSTTYPIHELRARRRLRQFRQANDRVELTYLYDQNRPAVYPHQKVEIEGEEYTISEYGNTPTEGELPLTLLLHNDYGSA